MNLTDGEITYIKDRLEEIRVYGDSYSVSKVLDILKLLEEKGKMNDAK